VTSVAAGAEPPMMGSIRANLSRSPITLKVVFGLLLVVATVSLYYPVNHHQFVSYDDDVYLTNNWHIKYGLSWTGVKWAFTAFYADNWHPLTWLSHGLDCQLFFLNAGRHHATNLLLHAMNALLLYWVLLRATGYTGRSFMVAALFALHPINAESVAWVSERKNLLSMFFFLLALGAYRWYARQPRVGRYATVALLFALGLMSKPQIITLPFVILLWDYWPLRRMFAGGEGARSQTLAIPAKSFRWLVLEKVPLLFLVAASAVITLHAQREATTPYPFSVRLANALVSYAWYVKKAFWPSHLALLYPHPPGLPSIRQMAAASLLLLAVTVLVVAARRQRYLPVGWLWFLGTLVPMIGLVQVGRQAMADRYAYLPFVGLFIMVCWGTAEWSEQRHLRPAWLRAASAAALLALAMVAHGQIGYWKDSYALWSRSIQVTSPNYEAENNLGVVLMNEGRLEEALPHLRAAVALKPLSVINNLNLAICEQRHRDFVQAVEHYQTVLRLTQNDVPNNAKWRYDAFKNLSFTYRDMGDSPHAQQSHEEAQNLLREYGSK
jgi:protein O-mannosyl-transferase